MRIFPVREAVLASTTPGSPEGGFLVAGARVGMIAPMLRDRRPVLPGLLITLFLLGACREEAPAPPPTVSGRVIAPEGVAVEGLTVLASGVTSGRERLVTVREGGRFTLELPGIEDDRVDLQVTRVPVVASLEEYVPPRDVVHRIGDHEGFLRHVPVGATDVEVRLVPRRTGTLALLLREPDGGPAAGALVTADCMADSLVGRTDPGGLVSFADVPVRGWTVEVRRLGEVLGLERVVVPERAPIEIHLREPWTVGVRVEGDVPEGAFLMVARAGRHSWHGPLPWSPDRAGRHELRVDPAVGAIEVTLHTAISAEGLSRRIGSGTLTARPGAEATLVTSGD
jgi:hypothetical protein